MARTLLKFGRVISFQAKEFLPRGLLLLWRYSVQIGDLVKLNREYALHIVPWNTIGVIVESVLNVLGDGRTLYRVQWSDYIERGGHWERELETISEIS